MHLEAIPEHTTFTISSMARQREERLQEAQATAETIVEIREELPQAIMWWTELITQQYSMQITTTITIKM